MPGELDSAADDTMGCQKIFACGTGAMYYCMYKEKSCKLGRYYYSHDNLGFLDNLTNITHTSHKY